MVVALLVQLLMILFYVTSLLLVVVRYLTTVMKPRRPAMGWPFGYLISPGCWDL